MVEKKEKIEQSYPNRYFCSVLDEMREAHKANNYSYFGGLIEELQVLGNRMEAALEDQKDYNRAHDKLKALKVEYNELVEKYNEVADKVKD